LKRRIEQTDGGKQNFRPTL